MYTYGNSAPVGAAQHGRRRLLGACVVLALGGCASFSEDGGFDAVRQAVRERGGSEAHWARSEQEAGAAAAQVRRLLAEPLGPEAAVAVALFNHPGLQAAYAELGIAEAELVQAGRWINPGFSYARLRRAGEVETERKFIFDLMDLITLPQRKEIAGRRFEQARMQAAADTLAVAAQARRAWYAAVAAQQAAVYFEQVQAAADAAAELAARMAKRGNFSRLQRLREQALQADATAQLARARQAVLAAREKLTRALGLGGGKDAFTLPERLPDLPETPRELADSERAALRDRLDLRAAQLEAESLAAALGLTQATGYVNVLDLGLVHNSADGSAAQTGLEIGLRLPVFDAGDARLARARHVYMRAVQRAAELAVNARSEAREAHATYLSAYDLARRYRDEIVPLRKAIAEENLLRYNGMLASVFELLADAREQSAGVAAYIDALREFWFADADLRVVLTGRSPGPLAGLPAGGY